ncbi:Endonuclease MUS81, partial [Pseudoloma neurophilia]
LITYENLNDFDYIPGYNTTAYNILKSLDQSDGQSLSYINLSLKLFNDNLDSNMYVSSAIKTLIRRNLIEKEDKKYYMTNKGRALSRILFFNQDSRNRNELSTNKQSVFKFEHNLVKNGNLISGNTFSHGNLQTGTGQSRTDEILLLVDSREMKSKNDRTFFERNLPNSKSITLSIGDFIWLKNQFLINIIIERKKSTDFISSLSDGRFNEQKKRLKALGIKNIIYLIEGMKQKENFVENA